MKYSVIEPFNIDNGEGARVVLWEQFCPHRCPSCHNPHTWGDGGKEFGEEERDLIMYYLDEYFPKDLSILGGEPLCEPNVEGTYELLKYVKEHRPQTDIWMWTGYTWDELNEQQKKCLPYIDTLIDGRFEIDKKVEGLKWKGSENQNIIDVQESLKQGKMILDERYV